MIGGRWRLVLALWLLVWALGLLAFALTAWLSP